MSISDLTIQNVKAQGGRGHREGGGGVGGGLGDNGGSVRQVEQAKLNPNADVTLPVDRFFIPARTAVGGNARALVEEAVQVITEHEAELGLRKRAFARAPIRKPSLQRLKP